MKIQVNKLQNYKLTNTKTAAIKVAIDKKLKYVKSATNN